MISQTLKIGLPLLTLVAICLAVMWTVRNQDDPIEAPADAAHTAAVTRGGTTPPPRPSAASAPLTANPPASPVMTQISPAAPPYPDAGAEDLPISLQFRRRPDLGRIQGSVMNHSGSDLVIDATIYDPNTRETAKIQLDVAPYTAKPFGVDDGLDMQSGDRITLQSAPYRDRVTQIP